MFFILIYLLANSFECSKGYIIEYDPLGQVCRDDFNRPVAWWYIYKPPAGVVHHSGQNFSFLSPNTDGRWIPAPMGITEADVLSNTLMPDYKQRSYKNRAGRAATIFESGADGGRSSARGIVVADHKGGFLLTHTVPGFPVKFNSPVFPLEELENGHLLACLSLDLSALNKVARAIKEVAPNITYSHMPETLAHLLPNWDFDNPSPPFIPFRLRPSIYSLIRANETIYEKSYYNSGGPIEVVLLARPPGVKSCIYSSFAARQSVMLNVYGQSRSTFLTTACSVGFGVRNIDALCLKFEGPEGPGTGHVYYVPTKSTDSTWFAVSTAAHRQQSGAGPRQYWVCTSLVDKEDVTGKGGMLLCVQNFGLWVAFDNLKVTEPSCD